LNRRDLLKGGIAAATLAVGKEARAKKKAPDYMPILNHKMAQGVYLPYYEEREITEPVLLCDERGALNPEAVGWSRRPLTRANLKGHWHRKKKWNFWNWISPRFVFSVTLADIDYLAFCAVTFTDFETLESLSGMAVKRGGSLGLPEEVEQSVSFKGRGADYAFDHRGDHIRVNYTGRGLGGKDVSAEFVIHKPEGHETLNIVVPWSSERFQMNSKHNTLPCEGYVSIGGRRYEMDPEDCHGVQDFGRGMWPYRSYWNWGVATGKQGDDLIGVNFGDKWTTGTGSNENGICYNGRLYKIMEDLKWEYDPGDWMKPWRVRSEHSDVLDMTLTPVIANNSAINLGVVGTGGVCAFGHWRGVIRPGGKKVEIENLIGWAEEFSHRW
jgi:hypothetical protein